MTWEDLFGRASRYEVDLGDVCDALAERREGRDGST